MKLNNKGFAISGILYAVMLLFLTLVASLLALISNRKLILDKYKRDIKDELNFSANTYNARIQLDENTAYVRLTEEELSEYDFKSQVSGCLKGGETDAEVFTLCQFNESDITNILNYRLYDSSEREIIGFDSELVESSDGFKTHVVHYNYYEKDSEGNYLLDETKRNLKVSKGNLQSGKENIFYVRYYLIDSHNILAKEVTRNLVVSKYNNYVNVVNSYFKISRGIVINYDYTINANSYVLNSNNLVKDNTLLNYDIYNSDDELITFYEDAEGIYYKTSSNKVVNLANNDEKYRIRYYTGTRAKPTSEIKYAYFTFE